MKLLMIPILLIGLLSCGSEGGKKEVKRVDEGKVVVSTPAVQVDPVMKKGERVFKSNCMACHQKDGTGLSRINPPLINTEWVLGDKTRLINIVLNGFKGEIVVNEVKYNSIMASFSYLSNTEVSAVLTYVRNSFGNKADAVIAEEVAAVRANNAGE
ncbi:MAG: cytochrome c [Reichenbachiella sp.]